MINNINDIRRANLSEPSIHKHSDEYFKDNIEHLEALEFEARLRLAISYYRGGKNSQKGSRLILQSLTETGSEDDPRLPMLMLPDNDFQEMTLRDLELLLKKTEEINDIKTKNSIKNGVKILFESFCSSYNLNDFERIVVQLLLINNTGKEFRDLYNLCQIDHVDGDGGMSIGAILTIINSEYREQVHNTGYFSNKARLIQNKIIVPRTSYKKTTTILDIPVHLHERITRFILGDNNIYDVDLKYISREKSNVKLNQVILPENLKKEVLELAKNFLTNKSEKKKAMIDEFYGYGTGLNFLFHGISGVGKTMFAYALANELDKDILSVDFVNARQNFSSEEDLIKYVFTEAKLCDGIVFFDECDDVFRRGSHESRTLLIEIEKADCITILATNDAQSLDPAINRRITMKVSFHLPDKSQREDIWKALVPPGIVLAEDVDFGGLAERYIFTGGHIKNTMFIATNRALSNNIDSYYLITQDDIIKAADHQASDMFDIYNLGETYSPDKTIKSLPLRPPDRTIINNLADVVKVIHEKNLGIKLIIGTTDIQTGIDCVDSIAYECGFKVKVLDLSEIIFASDPSRVKIDPLTQLQISPMDYTLRQLTGHKVFTMFVDHSSIFFTQNLAGDEESGAQKLNPCSLFHQLKNFNGLFFLVTSPFNSNQLPNLFDYYIELHSPPEELQIKHWEHHLNSGNNIENEIIKLVETFPLHLHEIDNVVKQAEIYSILHGDHGKITLDHAYNVLVKMNGKFRTPILFGNSKECPILPNSRYTL